MVLGDIVTGINLVRQSVDFIKSTINTAKDVNDIVGAIDDLLDGEQQINAKRSKKDGVSLKDQLGIKSVAHEVIDAKIAAEQRYEMSILIDQRFGHGTFKSIVDLRAKRIQEAKERAKEEGKSEEGQARRNNGSSCNRYRYLTCGWSCSYCFWCVIIKCNGKR